MLHKSTLASLLVLIAAGLNSAELSRQGSRLAENLGMLLGLPLDEDVPRTNASAVPSFLMDVYNCWTELGSDDNRASCLPVGDRTAKHLNDVNVVRGIKGTAVDTTTGGVYSHSPHNSVLPPSLTYSFNVSLRKIKEDIRYTYARIPKHSLSEKDLEHVKEQCNGPISLQLLVRLHSNQSDAPHSVFTLLSSARIQENSVGRSFPVEFSEITPQFRRWQKDGEDADRQGDIVEMRLIVGGSDSCYDAVTPQDLGFRPNTSAHLVIFSKSDDSEEAIIKAGLAELAAEATASRQRRNAERETVVNEEERPSEADLEEEVDEDNMTRLTNHELFNMSHYHLRSCRRYSHIISFEDLGWQNYIIQPSEYEANFCAGSCDYPLTGDYNTTKHSYIQSLAAKLNPELVPPPCCAPHELRPVTVIYDQGNEVFVAQEWHGIRAESCGCK